MSEYIVGTDGHEGHWLTGEEIIRCKDCRHYKPFEALKIEGYKCTRVSTPFEIEPDGYCAWGERRPTWRELENSDQYAAAAHTFDTTNHNVCFERGE